MRTYLRVVNPVVSAVVLLLCCYAATVDEGDFEPGGLLEGGLATYFLAKGLFCGSALFILGGVLLRMMGRPEGAEGGGRRG